MRGTAAALRALGARGRRTYTPPGERRPVNGSNDAAPPVGPDAVRRSGGIETPVTLSLAGGPLEILLRRSPRARRLRVVIDHGRGVVVTVPARRGDRGIPRPGREVERFLGEREAWVRRHLERQQGSADRAVRAAALRDGTAIPFRGEPHAIRVVPAAGAARRSSVERVGEADGDALVVRLAARDPRPLERVLRDWFVDRARGAIEAAIGEHAAALGVAPRAVALRDPASRWGSASRAGRLSFSWRLVLAPPAALETVVVHELAHLRVFGHGPDFWAIVAARRPDHATWRRWLRRHAAELHATLR